MENIYTWSIAALNAYPTHEGQTDVIFTVHWRLNGTDAVNSTNNASVYGSVGVTYDSTKPFTPYNQLTLQQVVGWTQDALGTTQVAQLQTNIDNQIVNLINPPVITPPLPWSTTIATSTTSTTATNTTATSTTITS
jgi:hypothetical protein